MAAEGCNAWTPLRQPHVGGDVKPQRCAPSDQPSPSGPAGAAPSHRRSRSRQIAGVADTAPWLTLFEQKRRACSSSIASFLSNELPPTIFAPSTADPLLFKAKAGAGPRQRRPRHPASDSGVGPAEFFSSISKSQPQSYEYLEMDAVPHHKSATQPPEHRDISSATDIVPSARSITMVRP